MTIESLAESVREAKAKAGHPSRIKYPKNLIDAAMRSVEVAAIHFTLIESRRLNKVNPRDYNRVAQRSNSIQGASIQILRIEFPIRSRI